MLFNFNLFLVGIGDFDMMFRNIFKGATRSNFAPEGLTREINTAVRRA